MRVTSLLPQRFRRAVNKQQAQIDELKAQIAALTLNDLADVDTDGVTNGQQLTYTTATETWGAGDANPA